MHKLLIQEVFKEAEKNRKKIGDNRPSKGQIADDISEYLSEECGCRITGKRLEQYVNDALAIKKKKEDININQLAVVWGLCSYLGFTSYEKFVYSTLSRREKIAYFIKKNRQTLIISILTVLISLGITFTKGQRWMIWQEYRFVEVSFDLRRYNYDQLEIYDAEKMKDFRKIPSPNCHTQYFNEKGEVITWYFRHGKNDLEIFTAPGLHPTNGKTLKPITLYMIREHICEEY